MPPRGTLLLVRHAKAEAEHPLGDAARPLTAEGRDAFWRHARDLARRFAPERVVSSPLVRAVQTAELLARATGCAAVDVDGALAPHPLAPVGLERLALRLEGPTAFVGHEPALSDAAARLLGLPGLGFAFRKGGALCLQRREDGAWEARWFWSPGRRRRKRPA